MISSGIFRSSPPEVFLGIGVLKICSQFRGEHSCWSVISIESLVPFLYPLKTSDVFSGYIEITVRHGCSLVNLLHIFRPSFYKNTSERLLLDFSAISFINMQHFFWYAITLTKTNFFKRTFTYSERVSNECFCIIFGVEFLLFIIWMFSNYSAKKKKIIFKEVVISVKYFTTKRTIL